MSKITKRALAAVLKKTMEKKPLSRITVTELTEECGINRHTFYYHFKDLYDLVEWVYNDELEQEMEKNGRSRTWKETLRSFFSYALENKGFILGVFEAMQKETFLNMMLRYNIHVAETALKEEQPDICLMPDRWKFVVDFYACAFRGILMLWIGDGMKQDPEEIIAMLGAIVHEDGRNVLLRVADVE